MKKTMTFAIVHFSVAFTVAYLVSGSWIIGGAIALVEPAINTVAYYLHEKAWGLASRKHQISPDLKPALQPAHG